MKLLELFAGNCVSGTNVPVDPKAPVNLHAPVPKQLFGTMSEPVLFAIFVSVGYKTVPAFIPPLTV